MRIGNYTLLGRYVQKPSDNRRRLIVYSKWLEEGEVITSAEAVVDNETDPEFVIDQIIIDPDGKKVAYYASGGVDGEEYTATFTVVTSVGQTRSDDIQFEVREVRRG